jgi:hypothetical protein
MMIDCQTWTTKMFQCPNQSLWWMGCTIVEIYDGPLVLKDKFEM